MRWSEREPFWPCSDTGTAVLFGEPHEWTTRSVEHVLAERLGNASLKLGDVCAYWNNFFARSFENHVIGSAFVQGVLREFGLDRIPRKGAFPLEELETARGTSERLWLVDGVEMLRDPVARRIKTRRIPFPSFDAAGTVHWFDVELPFQFVVSAGGDEVEIASARQRVDDDMAKVLAHLQKVVDDPSLNEGVATYLRDTGRVLKHPGKVLYEAHAERNRDPEVVADIKPKLYSMDRERWSKFLLKIGWCFACRDIGRDALIAMGGETVLRYLKADRIDPHLVALCRSEAADIAAKLFIEAVVGGDRAWMWKATIPETDALIAGLSPDAQPFAWMAQNQRKCDETAIATWVHLKQAGLLSRNAAPPSAGQRVHSLRLHITGNAGAEALFCSIRLFGGVVDASVQLTLEAPVDTLRKIDRSEAIAF